MNNFDLTLSILTEAKKCCENSGTDKCKCAPTKITISKCDGEFRVPAPNGKEAGAYYTDDKEDAIASAKAMYKNDELKTVVKACAEFPTDRKPKKKKKAAKK